MTDIKIVPFGGGSTPSKEEPKEPSVFQRFLDYMNDLNDPEKTNPEIIEALHQTPNLFFSLSGQGTDSGAYNFFYMIDNRTADPYLFPEIIKEQCRTATLQNSIERGLML